MKKPKNVFFNVGSLYVCGGRFIRWVPMRRGCGGRDTNKIEMGCLLENELCDWHRTKYRGLRRQRGVRAGQYLLSPYEPVYRTSKDAYRQRRAIRRPAAK